MAGLQEAVAQLCSPIGLGLLILGTTLGIFVGAIPGLTGTMLIALTLPLTYGADPQYSMILLIGIYVGAISGGMITATLLRMPGTPASIVTTLDGYPMAQKGRPERALSLGIMASFAGGMISWVFLILLAKPIADFSTRFGPFEYFSLVLMALVLIASIGGKSLSKSLFAGVLGILVSMPGISAATGQTRLTFGFTELNDGFQLLPVLIGMFAISQILRELIGHTSIPEGVRLKSSRVFPRLADIREHGPNMVRSSVIGTWIGLLPGIGANIGSVTAYAVARSSSDTPEKFGEGHEPGVVAAESANNATVGGALIPLIAMGIPGSVVEAVLLGALVIHGLQPGPRLFTEAPQMVYTIMGALFLANIVMFLLMSGSMRYLARLASIPRAFLLPVILTFCVIGSYALANRMFDVWVMLGFGLLGLLLESRKIPLAPFVIGFVLWPIAEENLSAGLMSTNGNWSPIFTRPISLVFVLVAIVLLVLPPVRSRIRKRKETA
ncbi:MAG: putative tricarboxylic transport membrane protein [Verrucomicrobiales bacterium]|jgi:putative tricarboxylic transport membrane protein